MGDVKRYRRRSDGEEVLATKIDPGHSIEYPNGVTYSWPDMIVRHPDGKMQPRLLEHFDLEYQVVVRPKAKNAARWNVVSFIRRVFLPTWMDASREEA